MGVVVARPVNNFRDLDNLNVSICLQLGRRSCIDCTVELLHLKDAVQVAGITQSKRIGAGKDLLYTFFRREWRFVRSKRPSVFRFVDVTENI